MAKKRAKKKVAKKPAASADRMLALMGHISAIFSSLEFQMVEILAKMIDTTGAALVGSLVTEGLTLYKTVELIRKVMPFRVYDKDMLARFTDLCNSVDQVRQQRNFFVHGRWKLAPELLAAGKIIVQDKKWKLIKGGQAARRLKDHVFSEPELMALRDRIAQLDGEANKLFNELDSVLPRTILITSGLPPGRR